MLAAQYIENEKSALEQILPLSGPHRLLGRAVQAATSTRQEKKAKRKLITKEDLSDSRASQKQIKQSQKYQLRVTELIL